MMGGASIGLPVFMNSEHPLRVPWKLRYGVNSLDAEASADNLLGSTHGRFSCAASTLSTSVAEIRITYATYLFLFFVFITLPPSPLLAVDTQTGRFIVEQATVSEGANFAF